MVRICHGYFPVIQSVGNGNFQYQIHNQLIMKPIHDCWNLLVAQLLTKNSTTKSNQVVKFCLKV